MTRHDYELLAAAFAASRRNRLTRDMHIGLHFAIEAIADALHRDNPRNFNKDLFLTNSGVPINVIL